MPRDSSPQEFGPLLRNLFREHNREPALTLNQLREHWTAIAGVEMGSRTNPAKLKRGTLWVHTPDACWAYELQFFKQDLLNSIQAFIKSSTVTDLRFTVGREPPNPASAGEGQGPPARSPVDPHPDDPTVVAPPPVGTAAVQSTAPDSTAGGWNSPSSYDSEARVEGAQDMGAGGREDARDSGNNDGGKNPVREAFLRMRARVVKP